MLFVMTVFLIGALWKAFGEVVEAAIRQDIPRVKEGVANVAKILALGGVLWGAVFALLCIIGWRAYFKTIASLVVSAAAITAFCKPKTEEAPHTDPTQLDIEINRQDAEAADEDMTAMMFIAVRDVSENTPVICPRDPYSIQTSADGHIYMDGALPVHRFELRSDREIDSVMLDTVANELQACVNRQSKRFPLLMVDGHAPVIYDIRSNGTFFSVEIVRYSKECEDQIKARQRARIARKLREADAYDCDA